MMDLVKTRRPSRLVEIGPVVPRIDSAPAMAADQPAVGNRRVVGLKPKSPLLAAGTRMDPPMSVPIPRIEPRSPISAPSPPDEPPELKVLL